MHKYIFVIIFGLVSVAHSEPHSFFDGSYVGVAVGGNLTQASTKIVGAADAILYNNNVVSLATNIPLSERANLTKNAPIGELFAGYGQTWRSLYLGGEIFANASNYTMSNRINTGFLQNLAILGDLLLGGSAQINTNVNLSKIQYGANLRPGILLRPETLLFGRVGFTVATLQFNVNTYANSFLSSTSQQVQVVFPATLHLPASRSLVALQLGGGIEQQLNPTWSIIVNYIYTDYRNIDSIGSSVTNFNGVDSLITLQLDGNNHASVITNAITLGAKYHGDII